ncbi:hypothetical protein HK104_004837 [Borealophlyctis nickersoniae]|nr:hypothetical protein HK104_004837 [Borealophlyctis nickersoniae]
MDQWTLILKGLEADDTVLTAIESLRSHLNDRKSQPLWWDFSFLSVLFEKIKVRLSLANHEVSLQCMRLLRELVKTQFQQVAEDDPFAVAPMESAFLIVVPAVVCSLGHNKLIVRKEALGTLEAYISHASSVEQLMDCLVKFGLENEDWRVRKESAEAIPALLTRDAGGVDLATLVGALVSRLRDVSDVVIHGAIAALLHVKTLVGEEALLGYVKRLPPLARQLFKQHQGKITPNAENPKLPGHDSRTKLSQSHSDLSSLVLTGTSPERARHPRNNSRLLPQSDDRDADRHPTSASISDAALTVVDKYKADSQNNLEFGVVPGSLLSELRTSSDWKTRALAIDNLHRCVTNISDVTILLPYLQSFLEFLSDLLQDHNFKIALTTLHILGETVAKVGPGVIPHLHTILTSLISSFSDNKFIIRQAVMKIIVQLMYIATPKPVLAICLHHLSHDNQRIREEIVNVVTTALLTFPEFDWELPLLVADLLSGLRDPKAKVKYVTVEAYSVIACMISPERILRMLRDYGVEDETLQLLQIRFSDSTVPQLNSDGLLEHLISRSNTGTPRPPSSIPVETPGASPSSHGAVSGRSPVKSAPTANGRTNSSQTQAGLASAMDHSAGTPNSNHTARHSSATEGRPGILRTSKLPWEKEPAQHKARQRNSFHGAADVIYTEEAMDSMKRARSYSESDTHVQNAGRLFLTSDVQKPPPVEKHTPDVATGVQPLGQFLPTANKQAVHTSANTDTNPDALGGRLFPDRRPSAGRVRRASHHMASPDGEYHFSSAPMHHFTLLAHPQNPLAQFEHSSVPAFELKAGGDEAVKDVGERRTTGGMVASRHNGTSGDDGSTQRRDGNGRVLVKRDAAARDVSVLDMEGLSGGVVASSFKPKARPPPNTSVATDDAPADLHHRLLASPAMRESPGPMSIPQSPAEYSYLEPYFGHGASRLGVDGLGHSVRMEDGLDLDPERQMSPEPPHSRRISDATRKRMEERLRKLHVSEANSKYADIEEEASNDVLSQSHPSSVASDHGGGVRSSIGVAADNPSPSKSGRIRKTRDAGITSPPPLPESPLRKSSKSGEQEFRSAYQKLRSDSDWGAKAQALEAVQALVPECPQLFISNLHEMSLAIVGLVQNLRSSVSKLAIACLHDMYVHLGRAMEADLDVTVTALLKKFGEGNGFITDEVDRALGAMCENVSPIRAVAALLGSADHKNAVVRTRVACLLCRLIGGMSESQASRYVQSLGEAEKLFPALVQFLREGLAEPRNAAKQTLLVISRFPEFDRIIDKVLTVQQASEVRDAIKNIQAKGGTLAASPSLARLSSKGQIQYREVGECDSAASRKSILLNTPKPNMTGEGEQGESTLVRTKSLRASRGSLGKSRDLRDVDRLAAIYRDITADDWKRRYNAVSNIVDFVKQYPQEMADRQYIQSLFDYYMERCRDGNSKVSLLALQALQELIPILKGGMEPVINSMMPILTNQLAASSPPIRAATMQALDALIAHTDNALILQAMANVLQFGGNSRVKPVVAEKLIGVVNSVYPVKPHVVIKYAIPASLKLLGESKGDIKNSNARLLQGLYALMGSSLMEHTGHMTSATQNKLMTILST